ncbi:hypothetical protein HSBAA_42330 [Vreelandella sulfidaeris]|uniref:Indole-3-glycerol-phosphate synthase n=1 Tax=Vreelandella sulfidaeris TaxID=115553 RepID=A0A455UBG0_9GAMM|nr:hypothetical protein HSBAA_42330 [Halomonas sulfidaeris]
MAERRQAVSEADLLALGEQQSAPRGFIEALNTRIATGDAAIIAEVKKPLPQKALFVKSFIRPISPKAMRKGALPVYRCSPMPTSSRATKTI